MKKILMCRIAWMKFYKGRANIDIPRSGSKFVRENKTGEEIYNFKNVGGKVYAYFPNITNTEIGNLGANKSDEFVDNVLVVMCAKHPVEGGIRVVGWYNNAKVYRSWKQRNGHYHHAVVDYKNTTLISEDDRIFRVPETFGRNALYYIANHSKQKKLLHNLEVYIKKGGKVLLPPENKQPKTGRGFARQPDLEKRLLIEQKAITKAKEYYGLRYGRKNIQSVEKENKGWDLEVRTGATLLKIEVKGLSGKELNVELTPNEYRNFIQGSSNYKLFVLTEALSSKPKERIFQYQRKGKLWVGTDHSILKINIVNSARLTIL